MKCPCVFCGSIHWLAALVFNPRPFFLLPNTEFALRGRLYLQAGVPSAGPPLAAGAVDVRPTGDVRGNGAFAVSSIPRGTSLGDYTGEALGRDAFFERYPDGVVRLGDLI